MTMLGITVRDIGPEFTWADFRDFVQNLPPTGSSALYRAKYPKSWWWTPVMDFLSGILFALQSGNWQRGGGRGPKPQVVERPKEKQRTVTHGLNPTTSDELAALRARWRARTAKAV